MPALLQVLLPYIVGGVLLLAAGLFVLALWYFRRSRLEPYWRMRRDASRTGWRLFLAALIVAGFALAGGIASGLTSWLMDEAPTATASPTVTATATATASATTAVTATLEGSPASRTPARAVTSPTPRWTASPVPSATPTSSASPIPATETATRTPTATQTPTPRPTRTPRPTETPLPIAPRAASVTPPDAAQVTITGVAARVDSDLDLLEAGAALPVGITRLYFALEYSAMVDGVAWERGLYRGDELVQGGAYLWRGGEQGEAVHFFGDSAGFPAGDYTIRVTFSGEPVSELAFTVE